MSPTRTLRLGRAVIDGDDISFELDGAPSLEAGARDTLRMGVEYDYHERSILKDGARLRLSAVVDGASVGTSERTIGDVPLVDDSRMGFLELALPKLAPGVHRGSYRIEAEYAVTHDDGVQSVAREAAEGAFTIDVS
jgi:hypothetical protein